MIDTSQIDAISKKKYGHTWESDPGFTVSYVLRKMCSHIIKYGMGGGLKHVVKIVWYCKRLFDMDGTDRDDRNK